jgi:D-glycero-D-manno-heptose 1,7-bisphosphate phosphatase
LCKEEDVVNLHQWLKNTLASQGVFLSHIFYCPHHPNDHCNCRKPKIGMLHLENVDYINSWMIGDKSSDMGFGKNIGAKTILIRSQYAQKDENADFYADSMYAASLLIQSIINAS